MMARAPRMCRLVPFPDGGGRVQGVAVAGRPQPVQGRSRASGIIVVVGALLNHVLEERLRTAGFDVAHYRSIDGAWPLLNETVPAAIVLGSAREAEALGDIRALRSHERLAFVHVGNDEDEDAPGGLSNEVRSARRTHDLRTFT